MEGQKPHKNYTRADLLRYLQGTMPPAEMHQLEKDALEDPFLADALEGLLDFSGPDPVGQLEQLDQRWEKELKWAEQNPAAASMPGEAIKNAAGNSQPKIPSKSPVQIIPFYQRGWFRAAAAILLLMGLGLVMNRMFNTPMQETNGIAQTENKARVLDSTGAGAMELKEAQGDSVDADIAKVVASQPDRTSKDAEGALKKGTTIAAAAPAKDSKYLQGAGAKPDTSALQSSTGSPLADAPRPPASRSLEEQNKSKKEQVDQRAIASAETNREAISAPVGADVRRQKSAQPVAANGSTGAYLYKGQVTDKDNRPLSFVNLRVPNSSLNTYTDARGFYRIFSGDSTMVLELKAVGYQLKRAALRASKPEENITLELAVGKLKSARPKASVPEEMTKMDEEISKEEDERPDVEPADGWAAYQYYLLNNLRIPSDALQSKLHGTVEVSFLVSTDGKRSTYRVEKSLSPSCDREALRLLRDGPAWTVYNSEQPMRARVTVVF
jgi:hypothetical protein